MIDSTVLGPWPIRDWPEAPLKAPDKGPEAPLKAPDKGKAGTGTPWSEQAVLVRRKSHIRPIHDALRARGIPVDVVGLAGLLEVPEVLDTIAWLRVLADPGPMTNRWLARILLGPRFRIHYRDLTRLARWAAHQTKELTEGRRVHQPGEDGPAEVA